jgi:hypothetical protein
VWGGSVLLALLLLLLLHALLVHGNVQLLLGEGVCIWAPCCQPLLMPCVDDTAALLHVDELGQNEVVLLPFLSGATAAVPSAVTLLAAALATAAPWQGPSLAFSASDSASEAALCCS